MSPGETSLYYGDSLFINMTSEGLKISPEGLPPSAIDNTAIIEEGRSVFSALLLIYDLLFVNIEGGIVCVIYLSKRWRCLNSIG